MLTPEQAQLLGWFRWHAASQRAAGHPARALRVILGGLDLARRHVSREAGENEILFSLLSDAGALLQACGRNERAVAVLNEAMALASDEDSDFTAPPAAIAEIHQYLGTALDHLGDETEAAGHFAAALDLLDGFDPPPLETIANLSNNLGMIRRNQDDFEAAAALYQRAQGIFESMGDSHALDLATICNNQGSLFWAWSQPELARDFHLVALKLRRDHLPPTHVDIGQSASNLGAVYHDTGDHEKAGRNYDRALRILRHNLSEHLETYEIVSQNYADLLTEMGKEGKARRLTQQTARRLERARARLHD
jgi:tetratricopeptide (TPR) repeat protein